MWEAFATGSCIQTQKNGKKLKIWNNNERGHKRGQEVGHVAGRVRREWVTFVNCPRPCCWPRFWPRSSQFGHVLATFVATFRSCSTWPEHGHNMAEHAGHVTTWPMRHFAGHVSATFVATFRSRSWPRSGHVRGHVQTWLLKFFCVFFRGFKILSNANSIWIWDR